MDGSTSTLSAARLRCEALTNPLAVAHPRPRLSWIVQSDQRNQRQTAYQILAASSPGLLTQNRGDLWDSGKVFSDETINIEYNGRSLTPTQRCWWQVRVWDGADQVSDWSETAVWTQASSFHFSNRKGHKERKVFVFLCVLRALCGSAFTL